MKITDIKFESDKHEEFYNELLERCKIKDDRHKSFIYIMGISKEIRGCIDELFNFEKDYIKPNGVPYRWRTITADRVYRLAFNLWDGYIEEENIESFIPCEIFGGDETPYFLEGIKVAYPERF